MCGVKGPVGKIGVGMAGLHTGWEIHVGSVRPSVPGSKSLVLILE